MIVLNTKTFEELSEESIKELRAIGFSTAPGSIAKLFLNLINKNIAGAYKALSVNHLRAFLSTSNGDALDAIGELLQCFRTSGETDDNYKYRISQQCLVLATSNETAIRLAALSTEGVVNVVMKPYAMGSGTFTAIIIGENGNASDAVLAAVTSEIEKTVGYGIKFKAVSPTLTYIKIRIKLFLKDSVSDARAQEIRYAVQLALTKYFSALSIGESISIDKITQTIMNTSNDILSHQCLDFRINGEKALYVNQSCRWFERFAVSTDVDNVVVS
jgi:uncharacterized phage protein gp47/JayE